MQWPVKANLIEILSLQRKCTSLLWCMPFGGILTWIFSTTTKICTECGFRWALAGSFNTLRCKPVLNCLKPRRRSAPKWLQVNGLCRFLQYSPARPWSELPNISCNLYIISGTEKNVSFFHQTTYCLVK